MARPDYPSCQCVVLGGREVVSQAFTKACCDQWENDGAWGVKYSGTADDEVRLTSFSYKFTEIELLNYLAVQ